MARVTQANLTPTLTRTVRAILNWSAEDLADAAGVGVATVRRFEIGENIKPVSRVRMIVALQKAGVKLRTGVEIGVSIQSDTATETASEIKRVNAAIRKRNAGRVKRLDDRDCA